MSDIRGILLAAGRGRRFGSGGNKLLERLADGTPLAVTAVRNMLASLTEVYAVIAVDQQALADCLAAAGARLVVNPDPDRGMGSSLACGVAAAGDAEGWLVGLADMPWIQPASIELVVDALRGGATLVAPSYRGQRGHPVGFGAPFRHSLMQLNTDTGARALLQAHSKQLTLVEVNDPGILLDIDRPGDMARPRGRQP